MANAFGSLSLIGSSLLQHNRNFESIAQNLANSGTPGRKAERVLFRDLLTPSSEGRAPTPLGLASSLRIDHETQGQLVASSRSHHLAIAGDGYFLVQAQRGASFENKLTRNGDFAPALATPGADAGTSDIYLETAAGERLMGWYADDEGNLPDTRGISTVEPFRFETGRESIPFSPTTDVELEVHLPGNAKEGDSYLDDVEFIDSAGQRRSASLTYLALEEPHRWTLRVDFGPTSTGATSPDAATPADATDADETGRVVDIDLVFDPFTGTFTSPDSLELSVDYTGAGTSSEADSSTPLAASSARFSLDFSDSFAAGEHYRTYAQTQNGFESGRLTDWRVEKNGVIEGTFSNGLTRTIGQIALVDVPNRDGLAVAENGTFVATAASGTLLAYDLRDSERAQIYQNHLESSAIDIAEQMTEVIEHQHIYASLSRLLSVTNDLLASTLDIKR